MIDRLDMPDTDRTRNRYGTGHGGVRPDEHRVRTSRPPRARSSKEKNMLNRRNFLTAAVGVAVAGGLAACAKEDDSSSGSSDSGSGGGGGKKITLGFAQ